jgi:ATPase subunit of ABC transporter with duplicated ATPase domains
LEIGARRLLEDASFLVAEKDKVGLVGRNGTGKSSLISFVLGTTPPHLRASGEIRIEGTVGHLPQFPAPRGLGVDPTALSHVLSARGLDRLDEDLHRARRELSASSSEKEIGAFSSLEERYRAAGGYEMEGQIARLADGLGVAQKLLFEDLAELSGGQRRRVDLMRVLFGEPDTLVLDEPTNHLDVSAKRWLLEELRGSTRSMLVVSHDIRLLDEAITKVLYLSDQRIRQYKGSYTSFRAQLNLDISQREKSAAMEDARIQKMRGLADKWRHSTETQARKAKVLDRKVAKLESTRTQLLKRERKVSFRLPDPTRSGAVTMRVHDVSVTYGRNTVLLAVDFLVERLSRVVVIGRNGAGKSSLLRCLAGIQDPTKGAVELGHNAVVGYFAQEYEQMNPDLTALEHIDDEVMPKEPERRKLLASFGLTGDAASQRPASLSGGERARLSLAMLAAGRSNVLVLDEPTNNLDPASVEAVGSMLARWSGTIVAVSHDRAFVEALAPTHALHLPEERFDLWREEYLDEVELR